ncbi:MAG TPA: hypothetical protein VG603_07645 [Chitinophagales bacterium]|nr:hypothetical protein [Chitinophagales bacterium]
MQQSKFSDYISTMNTYELNRFHKYIQSPLYNEDERLRKFVGYFLPLIKKEPAFEPDKYKAWQHVFGKTAFNQSKYVRLLSDTVKKIEHFLVLDRFREEPLQQNNYLLAIMNERNLAKHAGELLNFNQKKAAGEPFRDSKFYYHQFNLQQQKNLYLENRDERSAEKNLGDLMESLDTYYLTEKLKYCAAFLHYRNFLSLEGELPLLKEVMGYVRDKKDLPPAIEIYQHIILSFTEAENEGHYRRLQTLLLGKGHLFATDELKNMFVFAMNYCINQINFGKTSYLEEILALYKYALQNKLLLQDGYLSQWDYKNIVTAGLRVKDFKWTARFIEDYKSELPRTYRQNAYTFNRARYFFAIKDYSQVLQLLQSVKYNDIFYQLDSKTTLLKTYYELGEWQPLDSLKDSFRILLRRKRLITARQKENYMNLLKLTMKLFRIDVKDKKNLLTLAIEIKQTDNVADKSWLLDKLAELGMPAETQIHIAP